MYERIAKKSSKKNKADGPNIPIAYPMGIPKTPYPNDDDIMKFAVFCFESL